MFMKSINLVSLILCFTCIYFILRILLLIRYLFINKTSNKDADMEFIKYIEERELERKKYESQHGLHFSPFHPPMRLPSKETQKKWNRIFTIDKRVKSIGTISLSILSIVFIIYSPKDNDKILLLVSALLPPIINLFNDVLSWFEIDDPILHKPTLPKRFWAKYGDKKHQMNRDDYLEYLENNLEENIDFVSFDKFCKDKLHKK